MAYAERMGVEVPLVLDGRYISEASTLYSGFVFAVTAQARHRADVLMTGGRFDDLVNSARAQTPLAPVPLGAVGLCVAVDKILSATMQHDQRHIALWSNRLTEADVEVCSAGVSAAQESAALLDCAQITRDLWRAGIAANLCGTVEHAVDGAVERCKRSGATWAVVVTGRSARTKAATVRHVRCRGNGLQVAYSDLSLALRHLMELERAELSRALSGGCDADAALRAAAAVIADVMARIAASGSGGIGVDAGAGASGAVPAVTASVAAISASIANAFGSVGAALSLDVGSAADSAAAAVGATAAVSSTAPTAGMHVKTASNQPGGIAPSHVGAAGSSGGSGRGVLNLDEFQSDIAFLGRNRLTPTREKLLVSQAQHRLDDMRHMMKNAQPIISVLGIDLSLDIVADLIANVDVLDSESVRRFQQRWPGGSDASLRSYLEQVCSAIAKRLEQTRQLFVLVLRFSSDRVRVRRRICALPRLTRPTVCVVAHVDLRCAHLSYPPRPAGGRWCELALEHG